MLGGVVAETFLNLGNILRAFEIYAAQAQRAIHKVNVAIHEARQHQLARGIDYFRVMAAKFSDDGVVAHRDDFIPANRERLGPGLLRIQRINAAMNYDHVRSILCIFGILRSG